MTDDAVALAVPWNPEGAMIAQIHLQRTGFAGVSGQFGVTPDEAILYPYPRFQHLAVFQNDTVFNLAILHDHVMVNTGERANIAIPDDRILADDGGAAHGAVDDLRPCFHRYS